jgi:hypothetical protein
LGDKAVTLRLTIYSGFQEICREFLIIGSKGCKKEGVKNKGFGPKTMQSWGLSKGLSGNAPWSGVAGVAGVAGVPIMSVIGERDDALLREKKAREQFEASFRAAVDNIILPAATQVKELVAPTNWICVATKSDNGLSTKVEVYQGNMKAPTGERPHLKIMTASKVNDVQIFMADQSSGGSKQSTMKVEEITERTVQEYLLALVEKLVAEGPPR